MILKKCPFCQKDIPAAISECPYCHRDESGRDVTLTEKALDSQSVRDVERLGSDDPVVRQQASDRLMDKGADVVPALIRLLNEHTSKGMTEAARILGRLRDRRAVPALLQALKIGDEDLRAAAAWSLHQLHDPGALNELLHELERKDNSIQPYLAFSLGGYQDSRVVPTLIKLAAHNSPEVAFQAVWALGEAGDKTAILPLRRLYSKKDLLLKAAAETALRRIGGPVRKMTSVWSWLGWTTGVGAVASLLWYAYR
jgi:HEAT repeat protein